METKIYLLLDSNNSIRYVGKTIRDLRRRLSNHLCEAKREGNNHRANWIRKCLSEGYMPTIQLLEEVDGDGCQEEIFWIKFFRDAGLNLVNETDGGEGTLGRIPFFSEEHRRKLSESRKGKGHPQSKETRRKISEGGRNRVVNETTRKRISESLKGHPVGEETWELIGKAHIG